VNNARVSGLASPGRGNQPAERGKNPRPVVAEINYRGVPAGLKKKQKYCFGWLGWCWPTHRKVSFS